MCQSNRIYASPQTISQTSQEWGRAQPAAEEPTRQRGALELGGAVLSISALAPFVPIHPLRCPPSSLVKKTDMLHLKKKERRKKVSISSVLQIQELLTLFSHLHHFPAPPRTAHPQPPIPFSSRKGAAASACAPNPAFPIKPELRHFEMLVSALPLCSQVTQNKKKLSLPFVFVVWFLKRSVDFSA